MKKILLSPWTALVTLSVVILVRLFDPAFVESVRLRYFDQLITARAPAQVPVHAVNIDEQSLEKYGQWPFPRDIYAEIIRDLYQRGAGLVVFNVLMPELDRFGKDTVLADTLKEMAVVLPAVAGSKSKNQNITSKIQLIGMSPDGKVVEYPGLINSVSVIAEAAAGIGIVNTFPEIDGVVRRMPLIVMIGDNVHPALSLEALRVATDSKIQVKIGQFGVEALRIPKIAKFNTDSVSRIWIDWSARPHQHDLSTMPSQLNGDIVVVGIAAAGLVNPIATAAGEVWPHYLQASLIGTMLTNNSIQRPDYADDAELITLLVAGLLLIFLMRWTYVGIASTLLIVTGGIISSMLAYHNFSFLFDATAFTVGTTLVALHAYTIKFVSEFLQKQQIKKQFSTYLSPDLVAKLIKDPSLLKLGGEEKELSIMFTDVRGFTGISEHYGKDVQGLTKVMNRYMTAMTKQILVNGGTLDKYIGDAQMAFWNAPLDETKHCKDAVKTALSMIDDLEKFNAEIDAEGVPPFGMGIGINTGVVVVGNMGSEQRFDYTCLGDAVNIASRLEGQSKNYGVKIIIGPVTAERLGNEFFTLKLDDIAVKGKEKSLEIYTVFNNPPYSAQHRWVNAKNLHNAMLNFYKARRWQEALATIDAIKNEFDGQMFSYYEMFNNRIKELMNEELPENWNGIYVATTK